MDIGASQIVTQIASSSSAYLINYSSIFVLGGGLTLAIVIITALIGVIYPGRDTMEEPDIL